MIKLVILLAVASIGLMVFSLVDAVSADGSRTRRLSKGPWIAVILLLPLAGAIAWLWIGRPPSVVPAPRIQPERDRSRRSDPINPAEGAADFIVRARQRAEDQRRRYEQQKKLEKDTEQPEAD